jgi:hypothetical protein
MAVKRMVKKQKEMIKRHEHMLGKKKEKRNAIVDSISQTFFPLSSIGRVIGNMGFASTDIPEPVINKEVERNSLLNMKISEDVMKVLEMLTKHYKITWGMADDAHHIIGVLPKYHDEDTPLFQFVKNGDCILNELEIPEQFNEHFQAHATIYGSFDNLGFIDKFIYGILSKKNHIRSFMTDEEHILSVIEKLNKE